jgi:hypothetical protein
VVLLLSLVIPTLSTRIQLDYVKKHCQPIVGEFTSWETSDLTWLERIPKDTLDHLLGWFLSTKVVTVALCEAPGMICAVVYLLEAHWIALALIVLAIIFILARVPNQTTLNTWLFTQVEKLRNQ